MLKFSELEKNIKYPMFFTYCGKVYKKSCKVFRKDEKTIDVRVYNSSGEREFIWNGEGWYFRVNDIDSRSYGDYFLNMEDAYMSLINKIKKQKKELNQRILRIQSNFKKALDERNANEGNVE